MDVMDFYFDPERRIMSCCKYGTGPKNLVIGMAILKKHASNPNLCLLEYRTASGNGPIVLRWWHLSNNQVYGVAMLKDDGAWKVRRADQVFGWEIGYDAENQCIVNATPIFDSIRMPPSN